MFLTIVLGGFAIISEMISFRVCIFYGKMLMPETMIERDSQRDLGPHVSQCMSLLN